MFQTALDAYNDLYERVSEIKRESATCADLEELADIAYAFRETHKYLADIASETKRAQEAVEKLTCLLWVNTSDGGTIRTKHCSATPQMKLTASIPKKHSHPERHSKLMGHLGVPEKLWKGDLELVRIHWPSFVEYTSALEEQGKSLPPGIDADKTYTVYRLRIVKKRNVNEDFENGESEA